MQLSNNFTLEEFTHSDTAAKKGISNQPGEEEIANLRNLCGKVLQPLRDKLGKPVQINSGYRTQALNKAVGGVESSQHTKGEAADIFVPGMQARDVFNAIAGMGIEYDQLILELSWVHVSRKRNRMQKLAGKGVKL